MKRGQRDRRRLDQDMVSQIHSLRALGWGYLRISSQLKVSTTAVRTYVCPGFSQRRYRSAKGRRAFKVYTTVNGKRGRYKVNDRRARPLACELCGSTSRRLAWHHWKDDDLGLGLWLCGRCHPGVHILDSGLSERYLQLKDKAEKREL